MNTELNFFEELDLQEKTKQAITESSRGQFASVNMNFKVGLLIGALSTVIMVSLFSFTSFKSEKSFEVVALQLDSIQISQNDRIIRLLEQHPKRDTVVVHIVAPSL